MPTRSGRNFSVGEIYASLDSNLQDTLKTFIAMMNWMDQRLLEFRDQANTSYRDLTTRLERLETNRRWIAEEDESRNDNRSPRRRRAQTYDIEDTHAQYIKSVKVDAPSFCGRLDPHAYIDWQLTMNRYFRWHYMSELGKFGGTIRTILNKP